MAEHKEHYPTMIEHPRTKQRVAVASPLAHHKQLLAWKLGGLEPVPAEPVVAEMPDAPEPGYPRMIEDPKTGARARVDSKREHDLKVEFWGSKKTESTTRKPAPVLVPPTPAKATVTAAKGKPNGKTSKEGLQPPTVEDFLKKNYPPAIAERMADDEIRKFNAGEAPYDK